jgi:hypothetical protein
MKANVERTSCLLDGWWWWVKWVPLTTDGGDGLQIWRVAAHILNKQLQTAKKWFSNLGVG